MDPATTLGFANLWSGRLHITSACHHESSKATNFQMKPCEALEAGATLSSLAWRSYSDSGEILGTAMRSWLPYSKYKTEPSKTKEDRRNHPLPNTRPSRGLQPTTTRPMIQRQHAIPQAYHHHPTLPPVTHTTSTIFVTHTKQDNHIKSVNTPMPKCT
jgi:hypothetical protein